MSGTRPYRIWKNIKTRCLNPNYIEKDYYSTRGITLCERWMSFENFWQDMKDTYSDGLQIDRIDVNKGYYKDNCRWTSCRENSYNQRIRVTNKSGKTGVYFHKASGKWTAKIIDKNKKEKYLGVFDTFEEAVAVREQAEIETYGYNKE